MKVTGEFQEPVSMARMRFLCSALTCQLLLLVLILIILNVVASGDETKVHSPLGYVVFNRLLICSIS